MRLFAPIVRRAAFLAVLAGAVTYASEARASLITVTQAGQMFGVNFDGNVNGSFVAGLTAHAEFLVTRFTSNVIEFDVLLTNTSGGGITSRVSGLGFDTTPNLTSAASFGVFNIAVLGGSYPNGFGPIGACFKGGGGASNCEGGGGAGVTTGNSGFFHVVLGFANPISIFSFDKFGVRYQSITGAQGGESGTGTGSISTPPPIPEPTTLLLLGTGLLAKLRLKRPRTPMRPRAPLR